eukprot:3892896-Rhodomonas_salina.1
MANKLVANGNFVQACRSRQPAAISAPDSMTEERSIGLSFILNDQDVESYAPKQARKKFCALFSQKDKMGDFLDFAS